MSSKRAELLMVSVTLAWGSSYLLMKVGLNGIGPFNLIALRFVPAHFFSVFMSVHPVLAALVGLALLGQHLALHEWLGIAVVVLTNAVAVSGPRVRPRAQRGTSRQELVR